MRARSESGETSTVVAVVVVAVLAAVSLGGWLALRSGEDGADGARCQALLAHPGDLESIAWDNGTTQTEAVWGTVLGFDLLEADRASLEQIADAVANDDAGFQRLRAATPEGTLAALDRMHDLAMDPDEVQAQRTAPRTKADAQAVNDLADGCDVVL